MSEWIEGLYIAANECHGNAREEIHFYMEWVNAIEERQ